MYSQHTRLQVQSGCAYQLNGQKVMRRFMHDFFVHEKSLFCSENKSAERDLILLRILLQNKNLHVNWQIHIS